MKCYVRVLKSSMEFTLHAGCMLCGVQYKEGDNFTAEDGCNTWSVIFLLLKVRSFSKIMLKFCLPQLLLGSPCYMHRESVPPTRLVYEVLCVKILTSRMIFSLHAGCMHFGIQYKEGDNFTAEDGCNTWSVIFLLLKVRSFSKIMLKFCLPQLLLGSPCYMHRESVPPTRLVYEVLCIKILTSRMRFSLHAGCMHFGIQYKEGDNFTAEDGCNTWSVIFLLLKVRSISKIMLKFCLPQLLSGSPCYMHRESLPLTRLVDEMQ